MQPSILDPRSRSPPWLFPSSFWNTSVGAAVTALCRASVTPHRDFMNSHRTGSPPRVTPLSGEPRTDSSWPDPHPSITRVQSTGLSGPRPRSPLPRVYPASDSQSTDRQTKAGRVSPLSTVAWREAEEPGWQPRFPCCCTGNVLLKMRGHWKGPQPPLG